VMGGGLPAAAFGGRALIMDLLAPLGPVYQAGTLSGNPLATAAGLATLRLLDPDAYRRLGRLTAELAEGLRDAAGSGVQVTHAPGLLTLFFSERPVIRYGDAKACDLDAHAAFCRAMLDRGVYPPPSQFEAWFPSLAHTEADVDRTLEAAREALLEIG
jgi:glutamate-1-semialdehyde 2,1-aminomutase